MNKEVKKTFIETKVTQKIATATKLALVMVVASSVLLLSFLAKVISYEFYILSQKSYQSILSSNVVGYVRDANTEETLSGIEISFNELKTVSDDTGYYKLSLPSIGKYEVRVSGESVGYYNKTRDFLPVGSLPYVHNIYLKK